MVGLSVSILFILIFAVLIYRYYRYKLITISGYIIAASCMFHYALTIPTKEESLLMVFVMWIFMVVVGTVLVWLVMAVCGIQPGQDIRLKDWLSEKKAERKKRSKNDIKVTLIRA